MVNQFGSSIGTSSGGASAGTMLATVALVGTTLKTLLANTQGVYRVQVSCDTPGGPMLSCDIEKRSASDTPNIKNALAWPASDTCALGITWDVGGGIQLSKSLGSFDGTYSVVVVGAM